MREYRINFEIVDEDEEVVMKTSSYIEDNLSFEAAEIELGSLSRAFKKKVDELSGKGE